MDILILSGRGAGGVRPLAELVTQLGARPVLLSESPDDPNRDACGLHLVVDWDTAVLDDVESTLSAAGVTPAAVVNMVESLVPWQVAVSKHYGLPGAAEGRAILGDKAKVRALLRELGRSTVHAVAGRAGSLDTSGVTAFPVIVKPSRKSGASRMVLRADDPAQLRERVAALAAAEGDDFDVIVEEYLDGVEFSVDGPVVDGRFVGLFAVEKPDHDEERHHDSGLLVAPPQTPHVRPAVATLVDIIGTLCGAVDLSGLWLHVEGRALADGRVEVLEVNARPGGRLYRAAILRSCGVDPFWETLMMALDRSYTVDCADVRQSEQLYGMRPFDLHETGTVVDSSTVDEWLGIEGVVLGYVQPGFEVTTLHRENIYAEALITAPTLAELRRIAGLVEKTFHVQVA
ncbi:hypothetical protein Val02_52590 [Virgisporangium aliadipatigenens]|uniref:ATP-grasp domain-containing protein n=1 Tax=Virgisporangium aliadipatigenens TaxID=741659 RepID=A0A8J4DSY8_9ACTN|nr:ATP-grasp domain-containing protein [Virgisporangium aliadipatigenens]GIJ48373.1 hypothetical protein Val02_52590 [Virgisporangium aliadipatigenens]